MTPSILDCPMIDNDAGADTVREYLKKLLATLWEEADEFSGKRPFGNSDWQDLVYVSLGKAGLITCTLDSDGYIEECDAEGADHLILAAIRILW